MAIYFMVKLESPMYDTARVFEIDDVANTLTPKTAPMPKAEALDFAEGLHRAATDESFLNSQSLEFRSGYDQYLIDKAEIEAEPQTVQDGYNSYTS